MDATDLDHVSNFDHVISELLQFEDSIPSSPAPEASQANSSPVPLAQHSVGGRPSNDSVIDLGQQASGTPRKRRFAPRRRDGCLTCRARHKKCDAGRPVCRTCVRVNATCRWPEKLEISQHGACSSESGPNSSNAQNSPAAVPSMHSDASLTPVSRNLNLKPRYGRQPDPSEAALDRHLLSHYIYAVIPQTTIAHGPANLFTGLYIPMAFQHTAVFDMIIACSASHLAKSTADLRQAEELNFLALRRQNLALDFIKKPLYLPEASDWASSQLEIIAVLLLAISLGAQGRDRSIRWMQRVNCVRELLDVHQASLRTTTSSAWETSCIKQHFRYYDVMSLIMEEALDSPMRQDLAVRSGPFADCSLTNPMLRNLARTHYDAQSEDLEAQQALSEPSAADAHCLLGLSEGLFDITTRLRDLPKIVDSNAGQEASFWKLHREIVNWRHDDAKATKLDFGSRLDLVALSECHRLTALILLFRRHPGQRFHLPILATEIMSIVQKIDSESIVAKSLAPILFLAGTELQSKAGMDQCATRLDAVAKASGSEPSCAAEVLRMIWRDGTEHDCRPDRIEVLQEQKWTVNLG